MLKSTHIEKLQHTLNIAKINLLKLEDQKLDSISFELIYFEYRDYLHSINQIRFIIEESNQLVNQLKVNEKQLANIKFDYNNQKELREELDTHLITEKLFIQNTSKRIKLLQNMAETQKKEFDSLNNVIEKIIYE